MGDEGSLDPGNRFDERDTMFARMARRAGTPAYADYGREVDLPHPTAVVFLVEMDFDAMQHAPGAETIRESARQYYRGAVVSKTVAAVLCPFSHRNNAFHSLVRRVVRLAPRTHRMAVSCDDLIHGRRWNPRAATGVKEV